jgi:hypothetical protein
MQVPNIHDGDYSAYDTVWICLQIEIVRKNLLTYSYSMEHLSRQYDQIL